MPACAPSGRSSALAWSRARPGGWRRASFTNPKLSLHTLHTHIGTYILDPGAYAVAARKLVALREQIRVEQKHVISCLNLGGGFPSHSLLHGMVGEPEQYIPPIERYADAITSVLNELPTKLRPESAL